MPTDNEVMRLNVQEEWFDLNACAEYEAWLDEQEAKRNAEEAEKAKRKRLFNLHCRTQEELEADPDYDDDF